MHGTFFDIGLGLGLALACGLRPFLPCLLAGVLGSAGALDVAFRGSTFHFLQASWWLACVAAALVLSYLAQLRLGQDPIASPGTRSREGLLAAAVAGLSLAAGALLFAGTLDAHGELSWPGVLGGFAATGLAQRVAWPIILGARTRLDDPSAREALTVYLDAGSLALAVLVAALHPLGYVALALLAWFAWRRRARAGERYAGLRILRR